MATATPFKDALAQMTEKEAKALWHAVAAYVENGECDHTSEDPYEDDPILKDARTAMEKLDAAAADV